MGTHYHINGNCDATLLNGESFSHCGKKAVATVTFLSGAKREMCRRHANRAVKSAREPGMITAAFYPLERCVDCGANMPGVRAPTDHPELSGSLMCPKCAKAEGMPTAADLGIGRSA